VSLIDTGEKRVTIPFRFKKMNTWVVYIAMRKEVNRKRCGTCHWWDPRYGGNEEPDETLNN
jgi:hypothetical protein